MNAAIITFHCSYNFGSALQAYALQRSIEKCGHEATIIDYRSRDFDNYKLIKIARPNTMLRLLRDYDKNVKRKRSFVAFWESYFHQTSKRFNYKKEAQLKCLASCYDCFVCGSDQIWNLDCTHGVVEPYFLSFAGDRRRVAYAPSLAHTTFRPENFDEVKVAGLLSKFDYLSVREEETLPLFQPLVDKPIDVVLDPTLLLDALDYADMAESPVVEGEYTFLYLLRDCPELIESVQRMADGSDMRFVYVSDRNLSIPNSINLFGIGPDEFVSLIAHAQFVLTNSFHATVFSVLFHKPFRVYATDKSGSRMRDLLANLGIGERCVSRTYTEPIAPVDWSSVDSKLGGLRDHSWHYLRKALS